MSGDPEQAYFADGITRGPDHRPVQGRRPVRDRAQLDVRLQGQDARRARNRQGARRPLRARGQRARAGDNVRVNAQLVDATTGGQVWADRYDGGLKNIFGLQDTVTRNVVKALAVELTNAESDRVRHGARATSKPTSLPEGVGALPAPDAGRLSRCDRRLQEGGGAGSELRPRVRGARGELVGELHALLGTSRWSSVRETKMRSTERNSTWPRRCSHRRHSRIRSRARCSCRRNSTTRPSPRRSADRERPERCERVHRAGRRIELLGPPDRSARRGRPCNATQPALSGELPLPAWPRAIRRRSRSARR